MAVATRFERALGSPNPVAALRRLAQQLLDGGSEPAAVRTQFEEVRRRLREEAREADEDAVMDVMDFLDGWCSPHVRLPENGSPSTP